MICSSKLSVAKIKSLLLINKGYCRYAHISNCCGKIGFLPYWLRHIGFERCGTDLCSNINWWLHLLCPFSFISNLFWRLSNKLMHLVVGCVMEGSMVLCQKNILGHSMMFHGDYIKRCLLTIMISQILYLTQLISEIKNIVTAANRLFSTLSMFLHLLFLFS